MTASVVSLVTGACGAPAATNTIRAPVAASAPAGAAAPDSTGYTAHGTLHAVAATSGADAWAVGDLGQENTPLIVHWNGSKWSSVPTGAPADTLLHAVAASSPGNAWALGETYHTDSTVSTSVLLHWNDRAWRQVHSLALPGAHLASVSVTSPADAWAVGSYFASGVRPVALHWNGSVWRRVPLPRLPIPAGGGAQLNGVSDTSASNAWAVGAFLSEQGTPGAGFVLHWNGSSWTQVPSAPASAGNPIAVVATATDYAWLLGAVTGLWNGHDWTTVPIPLLKTLPDGRGGDVSALAVSGHIAWVAGQYCTTTTMCENGFLLPMLLRWTGDAWKLTPPPGNSIVIFGLAMTSPTNAWAVGNEGPLTTVILHWNGSTWS
jgi:hypothetical protein